MFGTREGRSYGVSKVALGAIVGCLFMTLSGAPAGAEGLIDLSGPAFQILAPGEDGSAFPTEHSSDQGKLYDALTALNSVSAKNLEEDYVSEKFGVVGPVLREEVTGREGLVIKRDKNDIPHIFGTTAPR